MAVADPQTTPTPPAALAATPTIDTAGIAKNAQTQAAAQVQAEIAAQVNPLTHEIAQDQTQQGRSLAGITSEFNALQPTVNKSAAAVGTSYTAAEKAQSDIFTAANAAMNQQRQSQAQQAQMLAQQVGAPVALGEFTAPYDSAGAALINLGAGEQLHTLGYAQAGVQAAQGFAGQVFPLLRTQAMATARTFWGDQIKELTGKINDLRATAPGATHQRFNELQAQELQFALDKAKFNLDAINSTRDYHEKVIADAAAKTAADRQWEATQAQITATKNQQEIDTAGVTGVYRGKPTIEAQKLTADEKAQADQLQISYDDYALRKKGLQESTSLAKQKLAADATVTANAYLDQAVNPQPGKTVTSTHAVPVAAFAAQSGKIADAYADPQSPTGWSRLVTVTDTSTTAPITDPTQLVDYLTAHGVTKSVAVAKVRSRLALGDSWYYGKPLVPDHLSGRGALKTRSIGPSPPPGPIGPHR